MLAHVASERIKIGISCYPETLRKTLTSYVTYGLQAPRKLLVVSSPTIWRQSTIVH